MKKILTEAVAVGNATARAVTFDSRNDASYFYGKQSAWFTSFVGGSEFLSNGAVQQNTDGSTEIYFGPKAPEGKKANRIQTVPGRGWCTILRLYSPEQPWFDKTWRPGEIEMVE